MVFCSLNPETNPWNPTKIVGKGAMLCKEFSNMMKKTWILSQPWFDTLVSSTIIFSYEWYI